MSYLGGQVNLPHRWFSRIAGFLVAHGWRVLLSRRLWGILAGVRYEDTFVMPCKHGEKAGRLFRAVFRMCPLLMAHCSGGLSRRHGAA